MRIDVSKTLWPADSPEKSRLPLVVLRTRRIRKNLQEQWVDPDAVALDLGFGQ
jgi:hypothetical protein